MHRTILCLFLCSSLTACTVGIVEQEMPTPGTAVLPTPSGDPAPVQPSPTPTSAKATELVATSMPISTPIPISTESPSATLLPQTPPAVDDGAAEQVRLHREGTDERPVGRLVPEKVVVERRGIARERDGDLAGLFVLGDAQDIDLLQVKDDAGSCFLGHTL